MTVNPITVDAIEAARSRIAGTIFRTPLVKLQVASPAEIYLKLENLQPINSFKLRGAANAVAMLPSDRRALGVWTISAGNAGQGVAFAARQAGVPCTVVTIETAPATKVERMRALGAKLVKASFDECWVAMERREFPGVDGTFVHPFDDDDFIAGNATMGLEIVEDLPGVATVVTAMGGGGLATGVAAGVRSRKPGVKIYVAEPETAAPASASFASGSATAFEGWTATLV
jgi:threonine dehydratase